nr:MULTISPECIES: hypothetical protein [Ferrimonas]
MGQLRQPRQALGGAFFPIGTGQGDDPGCTQGAFAIGMTQYDGVVVRQQHRFVQCQFRQVVAVVVGRSQQCHPAQQVVGAVMAVHALPVAQGFKWTNLYDWAWARRRLNLAT